MHAAVFPLVHLYGDLAFSLDHAAVCAHVDRSGLRIFSHHATACSDIAAAIQFMPDWGRKPREINVFFTQGVVKYRPAVHDRYWHRLEGPQFETPCVEKLDSPKIRI